MVRVLRNLSIREISSVVKGAGNDCRVVILKRDDAASRNNEAPSEDGSELGNLARMIRVLVRVRMTEETALRFLMFSAHGRQLAAHLNEITKTTSIQKDEPTMDRMETLRSFVKKDGIVGICKHIAEKGTSMSEVEFSDLLMTAAKREKRTGESVGAAFTRLMEDPAVFKAHHAITKARPLMVVEPRMVGATDATEVNDPAAALQQLQDLADEQFRRGKFETPARAFLATFEDPANASLANRAHRRPVASTR
jgi:hypothetical protein